MRIAYVGLRAPWGCEGGVETAVAELAPRVAAAGHEVTVYCRGRYNPFGSATVQNVRLVDTPTVYGRASEALVHTLLAAPRAALRHDVVHIHAAGPALCAPIPRVMGRTSIVTLHGEDWAREKWGLTARIVLRLGAETALRTASGVISVNGELADRFQVEHIPNGVAAHEPVAWDPAAFPALEPGGYHLFVGRLVPEKGLETLMRAVALGKPRLPVVVVGGSTYTDGWAERLRDRAPPGVLFTGPRFGSEKRMLLTHARSFLLPSRIEGMPLALLEACAAGIPAMVSDIGANREVLGDAGWFRPPGVVDAWATGLTTLEHTDAEALRAHGAAARERVLHQFSWDAVVARTLALYTRASATRA